MNGCRVREDRLDVSEVHGQSDRAGAFAGAFFAELDQPFAVEFRQPQTPEPSLEKSETRSLGPANALSYFLQVIAVKSNEFS